MRAFYLAYAKVSQAVRQFENDETNVPFSKIPWGHNILIITKVKDFDERLWYAKQTIEHGLSRNALENWITSKAYKRHDNAVTNFATRLPSLNRTLHKKHSKTPTISIF